MKKRYYSYIDFEKDIQKMLPKLKDFEFNNVYAMPRGGLLIGVRLSHLLGIPMITNKKDITETTLIVDDIVDSGITLKKYKKYFITCLHWKPKSACFKPRVYARQTSEYIVYPWERGSIPLVTERSKKIWEGAK